MQGVVQRNTEPVDNIVSPAVVGPLLYVSWSGSDERPLQVEVATFGLIQEPPQAEGVRAERLPFLCRVLIERVGLAIDRPLDVDPLTLKAGV